MAIQEIIELLVKMPLDASQIKQRLTEVIEAKAELKRLTVKSYEKLDMNEKYAIRYHVIVLAEAFRKRLPAYCQRGSETGTFIILRML